MDEIIKKDAEDEIPTLTNYFYDGNLIPIIGAGFSKGSLTSRSKVPDANETMALMKKLILDSDDRICPEELEDIKFPEICSLFKETLKPQDINRFYIDYFTNVKLEYAKKNFLSLNWKYAYTFNIDDAIEHNSDFQAIVPFLKIKKEATEYKNIFKLHGDVMHSVSYESADPVLTPNEYVTALLDERNRTLYNNLYADYKNKNIIFIGCSLRYEPDLAYISSQLSNDEKSLTHRYFLTKNSAEITRIDEIRLKKFGITHILCVRNYDEFYVAFYNNIIRNSDSMTRNYTTPTVVHTDDKSDSIQLIFKDIYEKRSNIIKIGALHVYRSAYIKILNLLKIRDCIILKGRRISGKTYLLALLVNNVKSHSVIFFPSTSMVDSLEIEKLLNESTDTLFVFDSNALSANSFHWIKRSVKTLNTKRNKIILSTNTNDTFFADTLEAEQIELHHTFDEGEIKLFNNIATKFGLLNRQKNESNIDYLLKLKKEYPSFDLKFELPKCTTLSKNEKLLVLILASSDKIFDSDFLSIGLKDMEIKKFMDKLDPLIELIPTIPNESRLHSTKKIVHNSKFALLEIINKIPYPELLEIIKTVVSKFRSDRYRRYYYNNLILYDALNQMFFEKTGAVTFIHKLYAELETILSEDLYYWLQRAKCIYRSAYKDKTALLDALSYAKKVYIDSSYNKNLKAKGAFMYALIGVAILSIDETNLPFFIKDIIYCTSYAIKSKIFTQRTYLFKKDLIRGKKNIIGMLRLYRSNPQLKDIDLDTEVDFIEEKLEAIR